MNVRRGVAVVCGLAAVTSLAACGSGTSSSASSPRSSASTHAAERGGFGSCKVTGKRGSITIKPVTAGTLTVATTLGAQGWWNGTTPDSIKSGYEYCMAADLANMAGLRSVTVKNVSFDQLVAGRTNNFDIALSEISITPQRAERVDFSSPYYESDIGVLVWKDADVKADNISGKKCGARSGTTSVPFMKEQLKCSTQRVYPTATQLFQALLGHQIDAAMYDTSIVLSEAKASNGQLTVVGQYKTGQHYGAVFPKGSPNEKAFDAGIATLAKDGTLKTLSKTYLGPAFGGDPASVPIWKAK